MTPESRAGKCRLIPQRPAARKPEQTEVASELDFDLENRSSPTQPMEYSFKDVIEISQTIPLTRLSQKMGGRGKIAVWVNISDFNGTTSTTSVE